MIYLDNSATTKPYAEVLDAYQHVASQMFGNPSSLHDLGVEAERLMTKAREAIAGLLQVKPTELVFTSGGTEGNNLAIQGIAIEHEARGNHIITTKVEHPSSQETFQMLEDRGFSVTYLPVDRNGNIDVSMIEKEMRKDTILVSIIHVNNELGNVLPVKEIGHLLRHYPKVVYHVDGVQAVSKVPLDIKGSGIDLYTISAHKFHGLKGSGVLFIREGVKLSPLFHGGSQEQKRRAGTENVPGVVAMAKALRLSMARMKTDMSHIQKLSQQFMEQLQHIPGVVVNTPSENRSPHIVNFSIPGLKPEVLVQSLSKEGIYVSTKSACSSKLSEPSHVLLAAGFGEKRASSAIRVSMSYDTKQEELDALLNHLKSNVPQLLEVMESRYS